MFLMCKYYLPIDEMLICDYPKDRGWDAWPLFCKFLKCTEGTVTIQASHLGTAGHFKPGKECYEMS